MRRETARAIDDQAARWAARADRGLDDREQAAMNAWLASDPRHLGAFARAQAILAHCDRGRALGRGFAAAEPIRMARRRWWIGMAGLAAAAAIAGVIGVGQFQAPQRVTTAKGQIQIEPLPDGSRMTLDTQSRVEVAFGDRERTVRLIAGTALFDVAKDKQRPFVVDAGSTRVRAVGTSFSVAILPDGKVRVVVREGVVAVEGVGNDPARVAANFAAEVPSADFGGAAPAVVARPLAAAEVSRSMAWREGMLAFEDATLATAAADFARYSDLRIEIADPDLAGKRITGWFSANDPKGFARAAAISLGARVQESPDSIRIVR